MNKQIIRIRVVDADTYRQSSIKPLTFFHHAEFNLLNEKKCEQLYYLLFSDNKVRLGVILGKQGVEWFSPFSASYGGLSASKYSVNIEFIEQAVLLLCEFVQERGGQKFQVILPPAFYADNFINGQLNVLWRKGFAVEQMDLNQSYHLVNCKTDIVDALQLTNDSSLRMARKNLNTAKRNNLTFKVASSYLDKKKAYELIKLSREFYKIPLHLSWQAIEETIRLVKHDFFIVSNGTEEIAAAVVFRVTEAIAQIIYWGDHPEYRSLRPMNLLAPSIFEFYRRERFEIVDIGISTEQSQPNYGLYNFKASLGCTTTPKYTFVKHFG